MDPLVPIVEMGHVTAEKIAAPALEIVGGVPRLPLPPHTAAMAPAMVGKPAPPVLEIVAPALRLPLQLSAGMGPAMAEKIVRHVHKIAQAHTHATIVPLQPGKHHRG